MTGSCEHGTETFGYAGISWLAKQLLLAFQEALCSMQPQFVMLLSISQTIKSRAT